MEVMDTTPKGRGIISVSATLWPELGSPETPEAWHKALLLPESYTVESVEQPLGGLALVRGEVFKLTVQGVPPGEGESTELPDVEPYYIKNEDGTVALLRIEIHRRAVRNG